ncbi:MAG: hypothetical protein L6R40_002876 [Gallowayella cf. fulva]|nr:MAG: hypothetical protein L6R40_002876 [Xanthomendoza cf. fulva]
MAIFAPLGCGFQTGAGTILNVLRPQSQQSLVIAGIGGVGLAAVMAAKYLGVQQIIAIDLVDERLQLAQELGATDVINSKGNHDVVQSIKSLTSGGADFAVDCTGVVPVIEMLIECIGPRGVAATVGVPPAGKKIQVDPLTFLLENKTYVGVIEAVILTTRQFIPQLMELHRSGDFPIERLCKVYPIDQLETALADLKSGSVKFSSCSG